MHGTGDRLQGWGAEMNPVVAAYGGRHSATVHVIRFFIRNKGAEAKGIQNV